MTLTALVVTSVFPTPRRPEYAAFNANFALELARQGVSVKVLTHQGTFQLLADSLLLRRQQTWDFSSIQVFRGRFLALGRFFPMKAAVRQVLTQRFYHRAVERSLRLLGTDYPDFVYAIFLDSASACLEWCRLTRIPLFVEVPESNMQSPTDALDAHRVREVFSHCHGLVADSRGNERFSRDLYPQVAEKLLYAPNSADHRRFKPMARREARQILGIPQDAKIVLFCGHFTERKGPLRVLKAMRLIGGLKGIFLGRGPQRPIGAEVLRAGPVNNSELPVWMSAADVYCLPSLAEGLANATVEAMACGLPLVVSDRAFNRDFLDDDCAAFVDPLSPVSIAQGLRSSLFDRERLAQMSKAALALSKEFTMEKKVSRIMNFVRQRLAL